VAVVLFPLKALALDRSVDGNSVQWNALYGFSDAVPHAIASILVMFSTPFWRDWTFYLCLGFCLLLLAGIVFFLRNLAMKRLNRTLKRLVEEKTRTIEENKEKLANSEALFRSIYENSPLGIIYISDGTDSTGNRRILKCNSQVTRMLGYTQNELSNLTIKQITHPDDRENDLESYLKAITHSDTDQYYKVKRLIHKDGRIVHVSAALSAIRDANGEVREQIIMLYDITEEQKARKELKSAQTQLIQSEKMASLGQLTAGVAHEINNPVNFISSGINGLDKNLKKFIEINEEYDKLPNGQEVKAELNRIEKLKLNYDYEGIKQDILDMIETIRVGAVRASKIVSSLQTFSHHSETNFVNEDIHKGIESTLLLLSNRLGNHIRVNKKFNATNSSIACYPDELNQVFMNIMMNAIQAVEKVENPVITISTLSNEQVVAIKFTDNGHGISKKLKEKIFEPFYTTKPVGEGTGLGLAISYSIIEKHKGKIDLASRKGETTFTITLPISQESR
jgi:PAS domain S-box-containing protein